MSTNGKKTVSEIIIDKFLKDVDEKGTMPWQRPYERYNAFNYFSKSAYRGINRLILPFGEYMTKNQIYKYNLEKGYITKDSSGKIHMTPEAYKFQKGIMWYPIVYFKKETYKISVEIASSEFGIEVDISKDKFWGISGAWSILTDNGSVYKTRNILRYYEVAERNYFKNAKGECLPSRIDSGEVVITKSDPKRVFDSYISREGINLKTDYKDIPHYSPTTDTIALNPYTKGEDAWFAIAFHEAGHSTGARGRLNREGVVSVDRGNEDRYAKEECIAEICSCLCCAETGISDFKTSGMAEYENSIAYVQSWKKRIKDWGNSFIYLVSQADKAFNYICGNPDGTMSESKEE